VNPDDIYDPRRADDLVDMLRALARRILALDGEGRLLEESAALQRALGDIRSELFRYEVRRTFDTPEVAEHRRIVSEAGGAWSPNRDTDDEEEDPWRKPNAP
jgi:hypothetical protein